MKRKLNMIIKLVLIIIICVGFILPVLSANTLENRSIGKIKDILNNKIIENLNRDDAGLSYWALCYTSTNFDDCQGWCIIETYDGGFIITGDYDDSLGDLYQNNIFIMKLSTFGSVIWFSVYDIGGDSYYMGGVDRAYSIDEVKYSNNDYGYVVTGVTYDPLLQDKDIYILSVDDKGNFQWLKKYPFPIPNKNEDPREIKTIYESNKIYFVVTGYTDSFNTNNDIFLLVVNEQGEFHNFGIYDSGENEYVYDVEPIYNSSSEKYDFAMCGSRNLTGLDDTDPIFIKINNNLDVVLSAKEYGITDIEGFSYYDKVVDIKKTSNNEFVMIGASSSPSSNTYFSLLVILTDDDGNFKNIKTYDGSGGSSDMLYLGNSIDEMKYNNKKNFVITGCKNDEYGRLDTFIAALEEDISLKWFRALKAGWPGFQCNTDLTGRDYGSSIVATDYGFNIVGFTDSPEITLGLFREQILVARFNQDGIIRNTQPPCCTILLEMEERDHFVQQSINYEPDNSIIEVNEIVPTFYNPSIEVTKICSSPGFELILILLAIAFVLFWKRKRLG